MALALFETELRARWARLGLPMRLATLRVDGGEVLALLAGDAAVRVDEAASALGELIEVEGGMIGLLRRWEHLRRPLEVVTRGVPALVAAGRLERHPLERLAAPVPHPGKVIAIGRNYAEHAAETGHPLPPEPMVFTKHPTSVVGPHDPIQRPPFVTDLDHEAELAVIIGRPGRDIAIADALSHVAGYCCANDVSARTAQFATGQFVRGKSFDSFCPLGPALVTADEVPDPQTLWIRCRVDGETRQASSTSQMLVSVPALIAHCSAATTLEAGDVILTGTPPGVAMGRTPPPWLQPGQLCEVEIEGLGRLANRVSG